MTIKRTVFFLSDSTGITAETLGESLLAHFDQIEFEKVVFPYTDTPEKAHAAVDRINQAAERDGAPPIIFDTVVNEPIRAIIAQSQGYLLDIFSMFLPVLDKALSIKHNLNVGRGEKATDTVAYQNRINAVNYALHNDDGGHSHHYDQADLILVGVSRSGKTPTCLYLALQSGIYAANYPLTEDDLQGSQLPKSLQAYRHKLFGLTIEPARLVAIREERRPNSRYSSITQCEDEIRTAKALFGRHQIPYIDTTHISIEEIATRILLETGLRRQGKSVV
jgi:regulator of PEP synthase PpsR (kinase-PPPase family)